MSGEFAAQSESDSTKPRKRRIISHLFGLFRSKAAQKADVQALEALGMGVRLHRHIDKLVAEGEATGRPLDDFTATMGRLLADRLNDTAVPRGYVLATELLEYDCAVTGVDGFTHEPMPSSVTGYPNVMYAIFGTYATVFARGAFGNEFANEVERIRSELSAPAEQLAPVEQPGPVEQ